MLWILFLFSVLSNGIFYKKLLPKVNDEILTLTGSFIIGSLLSVSFIYFLSSYLTNSLQQSLLIYFIISATLLIKNCNDIRPKRLNFVHGAILFIIMFFSFWMFSKSFGYDVNTGEFLIASNLYQDFGAHIPFIRSFSLGNNFLAEVPFFASGHLTYHFMFDLYAGILEFLGLRIDLAFNLISTISFGCLIIYIYKLALLIFKNKAIGILSAFFFLFSSNLSFLSFFWEKGVNSNLFLSFWRNSQYLGSGPLGDSTVSVFWYLNTYLNQRHLIFGILFALFFIYHFLLDRNQGFTKKQLLFLGLLLGILPFWHISIYLGIYLILLVMLFLFQKARKEIFALIIISGVIASFQIFSIKSGTDVGIYLNPGFLMSDKLSFYNIFVYWIWNLGVGIVTIPLGFLLADKKQKKLFLSFLSLFIAVNLFQFGNYMFDNHKLLNLWIIFANFYSAFLVVYLWKRNFVLKLTSLLILILLVLSGLINFMVIKNDVFARITDYPHNELMSWTKDNILSSEIILTNGEIYDPSSLIGKKIFLGLPRYVYLYGRDPSVREEEKNTVFKSDNISDIKQIISKNEIKYILVYKNGFAKNSIVIDLDFFKRYFRVIYEDNDGVVFKT